MRVGIVGAGFAGLAAATELVRAGVDDVVVLEARDRVGGRVWSEALATPSGALATIERGAEFVLEGYDVLQAYAAEAGLELAGTGMSYYVREPRGVDGVDADAMAAAGGELAELAAGGEPGRSVTELLSGLPLPRAVAEAVLARIEISCALEGDKLDAEVVEHVASFAPLPSRRIAGGNQGLAETLAARLGDRVRLGTPVRAVERDGGVRLATDGCGVEVDRVILAVPAPVLAALPCSPALPARTLDALQRVAVGHAAKLHVPLPAAPPASAVLSVPDRYWCWTATDRTGAVQPLLHCFAGSPTALARLEVGAGAAAWAERVAALRPELELTAAGAPTLTTWADDPWARGAYSVHGLASRPGDDQVMREPVEDRVYFAGEHTAGEWSGLMEGALRSGRRAAVQLLG